MNKRDRQIQLFLQIFLLFTGVYLLGLNIWKLNSGIWEEGIFEFYNQEVPVFKLGAGLISGILSLIASWSLWIRASWAYSFTLLGAGFVFLYNLISLGEAIYSTPYHAIPMVIIVIVMLQSFPFLMRRTSRYP
tara:strand:- start:1412 stop:1810 length:399 start_codon:yes stop_codon:yes gene_type:complete